MKKIEYFLQDYGILVKICLVIVWVLWAIQLAGPLKSNIKKEINYQKTRDTEKERQVFQELNAMSLKLGKEAEALGKDYTPKKYFEDLKALYQKGAEGNISPGMFHTGLILKVSMDNLSNGTTTREEIDIESKKFIAWNEDRNSHRDEFITDAKAITLEGFLNWLLTFYLRTIVLVAVFYIVRMADRKGILETILADKTKFIYSIVLWPILFWKYPFNVIREIRVEAELRRIGGLFKSLAPKEVLFVRSMARSNNYSKWVNQKRAHERSLILALVGTMVIHLLMPSLAKASGNETEHLTKRCVVSMGHHQLKESPPDQQDSAQAIIESEWNGEPQILIETVIVINEIWDSHVPDPLEIIPRTTLFGRLLKSIYNQIVKGIIHEKISFNPGSIVLFS